MIGKMPLFFNVHTHFIICQSQVTCNMQFRFDIKHMVVIIDKIRQKTPGGGTRTGQQILSTIKTLSLVQNYKP